MEGFFDVLGAVALLVLVAIGALSGVIAGRIAGGRTPLYVVVGIMAAVATPFVLAALGVGLLAAGGIALLALTALAGAVLVLAIVRVVLR